MNKEKLASLIDHTLLVPSAGVREIAVLCQEAKTYRFASVCVNPYYIPVCLGELENSDVKVCTVVGFPFGSVPSAIKAFEASDSVKKGADEIDMVINIGAAVDCRFNEVEMDITAVVNSVRAAEKSSGKRVIVKVILETCFLDDATIATCCKVAVRSGADFVKTSTGFAVPKSVSGAVLPNGASAHHIRLMRNSVGTDFGVKASGGIRSARDVVSMLEAGANRIGTSGGVMIMESWNEALKIKGWD